LCSVFPLGEIEFKRHAGPNWRSLSAPAILPLFIDYFPSQEEIDKNFTFSIYNVTLSEFERKNYSSNVDLLMEMVRQRITQDFQLVSEDNVNASNYRPETLRDGLSDGNRTGDVVNYGGETIRQFLSMGHRLQVLTYDAACDVIEVTRYNAKSAQQNTALNTFKYQYCTYCQETRTYTTVIQSFEKYAE
jgi:DEP domain-containing protein 5